MDSPSCCYTNSSWHTFWDFAKILDHTSTTNDSMVHSGWGWGSKTSWNGFHIHYIHIFNVFETILALSMCRWTHHHAVTSIAVGTHFGTLPKFWFTPPQQMIPWCTDWGSRTTWISFHIHHLTYLMCLRTFMCCVCADGLTIMLLHQQELVHIIVGLCQIPGSHLHNKWFHGAVVEALNPHGMASTSTAYINISIVFDNIHVLWMCRWTHHHHHAVTSTAAGTHFGTLPKSWFTPPQQMIPWWCSGWGRKPTWNGFHIHYMCLITFMCCVFV